jgi:hypothetical protein
VLAFAKSKPGFVVITANGRDKLESLEPTQDFFRYFIRETAPIVDAVLASEMRPYLVQLFDGPAMRLVVDELDQPEYDDVYQQGPTVGTLAETLRARIWSAIFTPQMAATALDAAINFKRKPDETPLELKDRVNRLRHVAGGLAVGPDGKKVLLPDDAVVISKLRDAFIGVQNNTVFAAGRNQPTLDATVAAMQEVYLDNDRHGAYAKSPAGGATGGSGDSDDSDSGYADGRHLALRATQNQWPPVVTQGPHRQGQGERDRGLPQQPGQPQLQALSARQVRRARQRPAGPCEEDEWRQVIPCVEGIGEPTGQGGRGGDRRALAGERSTIRPKGPPLTLTPVPSIDCGEQGRGASHAKHSDGRGDGRRRKGSPRLPSQEERGGDGCALEGERSTIRPKGPPLETFPNPPSGCC